ncbi:unnamed protein product [Scytosiphon promiscuus]
MHGTKAGIAILCFNAMGSTAVGLPPGGSVYHLRPVNDTSTSYPFLPEWESNLTTGLAGCNDYRTGHWNWRISGLGCNMNLLLSAYQYWVYGWGWNNLAVIVEDYFDKVNCTTRAPHAGVHGWDCVFRPMPHVCAFRTINDYASFLSLEGAPPQMIDAALQITNDDTWRDARPKNPYPGFVQSPHPSSLESREMTARHIWRHFQPWVQEDIQTLNACMPDGVKVGPYVGLHIRRGDKLAHEAKLTPVEKYLNVTVTELLKRYTQCTDGQYTSSTNKCDEGSFPLPEDIRGVYVASDDHLVWQEARELVGAYLPNVRPEGVTYMSDGEAACTLGAQEVVTRVMKQDYLAMVYLLHDIEILRHANIFVGTFSSNLGRFITTLRGGESSFGSEEGRHWKPN